MPDIVRCDIPRALKDTSAVIAEMRAISCAGGGVVHPCLALLMANVALYSGMVSFSLRPDVGSRMLPVAFMLVLGVIVGGMVFPALLAWTTSTNSSPRRTILAAWLVASLLCVLPGFSHYVFNEPLRYAANFSLGLTMAPVYQLYFSRVPPAWRGRCFGLCLGGGLLCWNILSSVAQVWPRSADSLYHPLLPTVFAVHGASIAILVLICVGSMALRGWEEKAYATPIYVRGNGSSPILLFMSAAFVVYLLSGIIDARLTPVIPASPHQAFPVVLTILAMVGAPMAGWLLDIRAERLFRLVIPICCGIFILTPSLAALGYGHRLHTVLQPVGAAAQFVFFVVSTVAVAGLAPTAAKATLYACGIYAIRMVTVLGYVISMRLPASDGVTVLVGTILALVAGILLKRAGEAVAESDKKIPSRLDGMENPPQGVPAAENTMNLLEEGPPLSEPGPSDAGPASLERLFDRHSLSSREREVAALWLKGTSIREIGLTLFISESTVKTHIRNILVKFGAANRTAVLVTLLDAQSTDTSNDRAPSN